MNIRADESTGQHSDRIKYNSEQRIVGCKVTIVQGVGTQIVMTNLRGSTFQPPPLNTGDRSRDLSW